ncbi:hypothetical protein BPORC_1045 [Bifidobacterium porcinum]|nr:hypothetical protein BPORC_1045 [Bifidobacterium porcinum]
MRSNTTFGGRSESGHPCDDLVRALLAGTLTNGSGDPTRTLVVLGGALQRQDAVRLSRAA